MASKPKAIIVDIDGTLANIQHRVHFIEGPGKKDWDGFNSVLHLDEPKKEIMEIVRAMKFYDENLAILLVTGRFNTHRLETVEWLLKHQVDWQGLYMRCDGDYRSDAIIKRIIYRDIIEPHYNVVAVFEDRDKVVKMWRELGLTCLQVAEGDF